MRRSCTTHLPLDNLLFHNLLDLWLRFRTRLPQFRGRSPNAGPCFWLPPPLLRTTYYFYYFVVAQLLHRNCHSVLFGRDACPIPPRALHTSLDTLATRPPCIASTGHSTQQLQRKGLQSRAIPGWIVRLTDDVLQWDRQHTTVLAVHGEQHVRVCFVGSAAQLHAPAAVAALRPPLVVK